MSMIRINLTKTGIDPPGPGQVCQAVSALWEAGEGGQEAGDDLCPRRGRDERDPGFEASQQVPEHCDSLHV